MGNVVVKDADGKDKQIQVSDDTEAIVLSYQEFSKKLGEALAILRSKR